MGFLHELRGVVASSENIRTMAAQSLVTEAFFGMFYVVWQPYVLQLGATIPQLGLIQAVIALSAALGSLVWGRLSDTIGRKPVYVACFACRLAALVFCVSAQSWVSFLGFIVFIGLSATWMQNNPAVSSLLTESVDQKSAGTAIGVYMSLGMITSLVTAPVGGYLALDGGYRIIFLSCLAGELISISLISWRIRETLKEKKQIRGAILSSNLRGVVDLIRPELPLAPFYVISVIGSFSYRLSNTILYGLLVDSYGFNTIQLGLMSTFFGLSWGLSQIPIGWLMDRYGRKRFMLLSQLAAILEMTGYILSGSFLVFLGLQVLSGLSHAMSIPAYISMVAERVPVERRSSALGKLSTIPLLVSFPAPVLGGIIYQNFGFGGPMIVRLVALLVSFSIVLVVIKERPSPR